MRKKRRADMKRWMAAALAVVLLGWYTAPRASAHALLAKEVDSGNVCAVEFAYSTGGTANYAEVKVYAPDNADVEFQNGRTDALGRFAFLPDKAGTWTVVMADGMGHKVSHPVAVTLSGERVAQVPAEGLTASSKLFPALLGVSLLANFFLLLALFRRRSGGGGAFFIKDADGTSNASKKNNGK